MPSASLSLSSLHLHGPLTPHSLYTHLNWELSRAGVWMLFEVRAMCWTFDIMAARNQQHAVLAHHFMIEL